MVPRKGESGTYVTFVKLLLYSYVFCEMKINQYFTIASFVVIKSMYAYFHVTPPLSMQEEQSSNRIKNRPRNEEIPMDQNYDIPVDVLIFIFTLC